MVIRHRNRSRYVAQDLMYAIDQMAQDGKPAARINRELLLMPAFEGREDLPALRTIQRIVKDRRPPDEASRDWPQDSLFQLSRFQDYLEGDSGIPWAAAAYLLRMWAWVTEGGGDLNLGQLPEIARPTLRMARWWWRVHLLAPGLNRTGVYVNAEHFTMNERARDLFHWQVDQEGLFWYFAYQPWLSEEAYQRYRSRVESGAVPRKLVASLHLWQQADEFATRVISLPNPPVTGVAGVDETRVEVIERHV